jgi:hypothetical protein
MPFRGPEPVSGFTAVPDGTNRLTNIPIKILFDIKIDNARLAL